LHHRSVSVSSYAPVMAGLLATVMQSEGHPGVLVKDSTTDAGKTFAERFAEDSAEAGLERALAEQKRAAHMRFASEEFDDALRLFEEMAHTASELEDQSAEAEAVLGMADCLAKPNDVDGELVFGMYRYARGLAEKVGNGAVHFQALVGEATLHRALGSMPQSEAGWEAALTLARSQASGERVSFALTQLGLLAYSRSGASRVGVVNDRKEEAGHVAYEGEDVPTEWKQGPSPDVIRAVALLREAMAELPESASLAEHAKARMNLASVLLGQGGTKSKRQAEQEMIQALGLLQRSGSQPALEESVLVQLVELYEDQGWAPRDDATKKLITDYRSRVEARAAQQPSIGTGAPVSPDERHAREKSEWAVQKLEQMERDNAKALESDSDDDGGLVGFGGARIDAAEARSKLSH